MIQVSVSEVKIHFSEYLNRAINEQERVIITSRGKPKAVIIGIEELERLEALEDSEASPAMGSPLLETLLVNMTKKNLPDEAMIDLVEVRPKQTEIKGYTDHASLLVLLQSPPDDDKGPEWWAEFEKELTENRFLLRGE